MARAVCPASFHFPQGLAEEIAVKLTETPVKLLEDLLLSGVAVLATCVCNHCSLLVARCNAQCRDQCSLFTLTMADRRGSCGSVAGRDAKKKTGADTAREDSKPQIVSIAQIGPLTLSQSGHVTRVSGTGSLGGMVALEAFAGSTPSTICTRTQPGTTFEDAPSLGLGGRDKGTGPLEGRRVNNSTAQDVMEDGMAALDAFAGPTPPPVCTRTQPVTIFEDAPSLGLGGRDKEPGPLNGRLVSNSAAQDVMEDEAPSEDVSASGRYYSIASPPTMLSDQTSAGS